MDGMEYDEYDVESGDCDAVEARGVVERSVVWMVVSATEVLVVSRGAKEVDGATWIEEVVTGPNDVVNGVGDVLANSVACPLEDCCGGDEVVSVLLELSVLPLLDICCGLDAASVVDGGVCAAVGDIVVGWGT